MMPLRSLKQYASVFIILSWIGISAHAAEVSCVERYESPVPEEFAKKAWPSGARPRVDEWETLSAVPAFDPTQPFEPVESGGVSAPTASTAAPQTTAPPFDPTQPFERVESTATCIAGLLRGSIEKGDYGKIVSLLRANHPFLNTFYLMSPGGNVDEAFKIGRLFRKYMIAAYAPVGDPKVDIPFTLFKFGDSSAGGPKRFCRGGSECICASACALIWFGAQDRSGTVGLHRPRTDDPAFRALSPAEATAVYRRMLDSVVRYLDEMEVPKQMIESMVATGSAEIRWVEAKANGLERPPSIAEWKDASCGSFTAQEEETMYQNMGKEDGRTNLLQEKQVKKGQCESLLVSSQRDRLAPP